MSKFSPGALRTRLEAARKRLGSMPVSWSEHCAVMSRIVNGPWPVEIPEDERHHGLRMIYESLAAPCEFSEVADRKDFVHVLSDEPPPDYGPLVHATEDDEPSEMLD